MKQKPVTDLPTWFEAESENQQDPTEGSVSVSDQELILADDVGEIRFSLSAVTDIRVGHVPEILGPVPPGRMPVTLAFSTEDDLSVALVANRKPVARKFTLRLVKTILDGNTVRVRHPARIGESTPETSFERGTLNLTAERMSFNTAQNAHIATENVTAFEQTHDDINGVEQELIAIDFVRDDTPFRSLLQPSDSQMTSILGRYLQYI